MSGMIEWVARALMDVTALLPSSPPGCNRVPVLALTSFDGLPRDHTQGTAEDELTQDAVLQLARAAIIAIRDRLVLAQAEDSGIGWYAVIEAELLE